MKYYDGSFAKDSILLFCLEFYLEVAGPYFGDVYMRKNPNDNDLSIQQIKDMILSGNKRLANRVSYYANEYSSLLVCKIKKAYSHGKTSRASNNFLHT